MIKQLIIEFRNFTRNIILYRIIIDCYKHQTSLMLSYILSTATFNYSEFRLYKL